MQVVGGRERESIFSPRKLYAYHDLALLLHPSGLCLILHLSLSLSLTHSLTNKRSETTKFTLHYISFSLSLSIHRSGTRLPTTQLSFSNQWQTVIQKHYYQSTSVLKYKCFKVSKILETLGTQKQQQKMRHEMI